MKMKWSKYNYLFKSKKYGLMVYNTLTNSLMEIKPEFESHMESIKKDPDGFDFSPYPFAFAEMLKNRVIVKEGEDADLIEVMKFKKMAARFDSSGMGLTIMVTEDCNFGCPYCFEKHKRPVDMKEEVQDQLIKFLQSFQPALQSVFITWFGGEPLMRLDTMKSLNKRIKDLGLRVNSIIVTNGWLLDDKVIESLEELNCSTIQVTIEGPAEIHDKKRFHLEHGPSLERIQDNLDNLLLKHKWKGNLLIHYNIDELNAEYYAETHDYWKNRYPDSRIIFGKNFVDRDQRGSRDMGCCFDREQEINFYIDQYEKNGGKGLRYYPKKHAGGCIATKRNGFVIGAKGQVYKCWHDVGRDDRQIGSIFDRPDKWDWTLISRYMTGVEPFDDPVCKNCFLLPVCEECPLIRYRKKYEGQNIKACARYKERLAEFLEIHYERELNRNKSGESDYKN